MSATVDEKLQETINKLDPSQGVTGLLKVTRHFLQQKDLNSAGSTVSILYCFRTHMTSQQCVIMETMHAKMLTAVEESIQLLDDLLKD